MSTNPRPRPFVLGVAGGTGSGKSTVADRLIGAFGRDRVAVIALDSYYRDDQRLGLDARARVDYDHPESIEWPLLRSHIEMLLDGRAVDVPIYDFANHARSADVATIRSAPIVVVEGILVLWEPEIRELMDLRVFVDADPDVRFIRRLQRDVSERGRSLESVIEQYLTTVRPAHLNFIEPSKRYADVIIPHGGMNERALDMLIARIALLC